MGSKLNELLEFVKADARICPNPQEWNALWEMLPDKKGEGYDWDPPLPVILSGWWNTPYIKKIGVLDAQIRFAAEHGVLDEVNAYLRSLEPEQWLNSNRE